MVAFEEIVMTIAAFIVNIILTPFKWVADTIEEIVMTIAAFIVYIILAPFKWVADKINEKRKGEHNGKHD